MENLRGRRKKALLDQGGNGRSQRRIHLGEIANRPMHAEAVDPENHCLSRENRELENERIEIKRDLAIRTNRKLTGMLVRRRRILFGSYTGN